MMRASLPRSISVSGIAAACWAAVPASAQDETEIDFGREVRPILEAACISCHGEDEAEGELRLDTLAASLKGGDNGTSLVPGKPDDSSLYWMTTLPPDDPDIMPPKDPPLTAAQTEKLRLWIEQGAKWPDSESPLKTTPRMDFAEHIQPILETQCVSCHKPDKDEGGLILTSREAAFTTGDNAPSIIPFDAENSALYFLTALDPDDSDLMPPAKNGGPLPKEDVDRLRMWVAQGAVWPDDVTLTQREKTESGPQTPDNIELVQKIHARIVANSKSIGADEMEAYTETIPETDVPFEMLPIPGGEFVMGSPESEADRKPDEGPQVKLKIAPFWMGKHEVTWDEYEPYMITPVDRFKHGARKVMPDNPTLLDAVSQPTTPYEEMSFGMGQEGFPAISMTQHAAIKFCQWLSVQTGHFYRLPTEAEWEYAARAGTTTAYSFGDDPSQLGEYAWYYENANEKYQLVGTKKPNPWGLHDMHGNVMEWVHDGYSADGYPAEFDVLAGVPINRPVTLYPRVARGGSWDDDPENLRSASRVGSHEAWKQRDPQLPKSIWYHTDAQWLGFRVVRPLEIPTPEEMFEFWNMGRPKE